MFRPKGPFDSLTGIVGIGMPLIAALVVEKELQDARERRENPASNIIRDPGKETIRNSLILYHQMESSAQASPKAFSESHCPCPAWIFSSRFPDCSCPESAVCRSQA